MNSTGQQPQSTKHRCPDSFGEATPPLRTEVTKRETDNASVAVLVYYIIEYMLWIPSSTSELNSPPEAAARCGSTASEGHNPDAGSMGPEGQLRIRDCAITLGGFSVITMIQTSTDFNFNGLRLRLRDWLYNQFRIPIHHRCSLFLFNPLFLSVATSGWLPSKHQFAGDRIAPKKSISKLL